MDRLDAKQVLLAVVDAGSISVGSRELSAPLPVKVRAFLDWVTPRLRQRLKEDPMERSRAS